MNAFLPYLYSAAGEIDKTAYWVKRIVDEAFNSSEKGFPGDEDNGSMSAWYVFSVLGMYPLCPGKGEYVIGCCTNYSRIKVSIDNRENTVQTISHKEFLEAEVITFYQEE